MSRFIQRSAPSAEYPVGLVIMWGSDADPPDGWEEWFPGAAARPVERPDISDRDIYQVLRSAGFGHRTAVRVAVVAVEEAAAYPHPDFDEREEQPFEDPLCSRCGGYRPCQVHDVDGEEQP